MDRQFRFYFHYSFAHPSTVNLYIKLKQVKCRMFTGVLNK